MDLPLQVDLQTAEKKMEEDLLSSPFLFFVNIFCSNHDLENGSLRDLISSNVRSGNVGTSLIFNVFVKIQKCKIDIGQYCTLIYGDMIMRDLRLTYLDASLNL